jgi:hypothetical protein
VSPWGVERSQTTRGRHNDEVGIIMIMPTSA